MARCAALCLLALSLALTAPADLVLAGSAAEGGCERRPRGSDGCRAQREGSEGERTDELQLLQHELSTRKGTDRISEIQLGSDSSQAAPAAASTTTPPPTGMSVNGVGDLRAFFSALCTNAAAVLFLVGCFCVLRVRYPILYSHNVLQGIAPSAPEETYFGWFWPTMHLTVDEVASNISLDHAMLLDFTHMAMKMCLVVGLPMIFVMAPLNAACGGHAAGQDHMSFFSFGNIREDSNLFWAYGFVVWLVVVVVCWMVHSAHHTFLKRRFEWLHQMSEQRANTLLVESVPDKYQSAEKLEEFLHKVLPGAGIKSIYMAKDLTELEALTAKRDAALYRLQEAEAKLAQDPDEVPMVRSSFMGEKVEAIPHYREELDKLRAEIKEERQRVEEASKTVGGINSSSAVVTFRDRSSAEVMLRLHCGLSADKELWEVYHAPEPSDILWEDLTQDDTAQGVRTLLGYLLVIALYFAYMPCVVGITNIAKIVDFSKFGLDPVQPFWEGFAPTIGLQIMVAFLPTFLITIFRACFTCRSEALQQHKLQIWYFWFQVVFVVLATAVGQNVKDFTVTLVQNPTGIFKVLAETMPYATHFYMNFLVLQWMSHAMVLTRYIQFIKFKAAKSLFGEERAKELAEPEDQDYYGMGSRSARWSIVLAITLVFGTLCPPINVLGLITFAICRMAYGYLFAFAETKKSDTGGVFWVTQLQHVFVALFVYVILMIGVLLLRAPSWGPGIIALTSMLWVSGSMHKFEQYSWEKLPIEELVEQSVEKKRRPNKGSYIQPAMVDTE